MFEDKLTPHCGLDELALSTSLEQQAQSIIRFGKIRKVMKRTKFVYDYIEYNWIRSLIVFHQIMKHHITLHCIINKHVQS